jgi:hypothetical protein
MRGVYVQLIQGKTYNISLTTTDAPAGVPWRVVVGGASKAGNDVTGPGTSTYVYTHTSGSTSDYIGLHTGDGANGTAGHLVTNLTVTIQSPAAVEANDKVPICWKQAHPTAGVGAPTIIGVRKEKPFVYSGYYSYDKITYNKTDGHFLNGKFDLPAVPYYRVGGDPSTIASAKVTLRFTPVAPKSPVEHTISWEAPVGWALYHIGYMGDDNYTHYYYAAMTDAEAATERAKSNRFVTKMWSPREGGWFVWMPVCWDASGVAVPMRSEVAGTADSGADIYSGYGNFPPNRSATSALADYTVANGYTDMASYSIAYTAITVELKNSGGTVINSWTGSLASSYYVDSPGLGNAPATLLLLSADLPERYWPMEWRGLFDNVEALPPRIKVAYGRDTVHGWAEWDVFGDMDPDKYRRTPDWQKIGDFRLAVHRGFPDVIEIGGVNLQPDLIGMKIMRTIVAHGVLYSPTPYVVVKPPDEITFEVMRSWGWKTLEEGSEALLRATWMHGDELDDPDRYLGMESDPIINRFPLLRMPRSKEVDPWSG